MSIPSFSSAVGSRIGGGVHCPAGRRPAPPAGPQLLSEYGPEYAGAQGACPPIHLLYSGGVHYDLLVAPGAASREL